MLISEAFEEKELEHLTVSDFVKVLQSWEGVEKPKAIEFFSKLVGVYGLRLLSFNRVGLKEAYLSKEEVIEAIYLANYFGDIEHKKAFVVVERTELAKIVATNVKTIIESFGLSDKCEEYSPVNTILSDEIPLGKLVVLKNEAFRVFERLGLSFPYPWQYSSRIMEMKKSFGGELTDYEYFEKIMSTDWDDVIENDDSNNEKSIKKIGDTNNGSATKKNDNLLRTIKALCMLQIEKARGDKFGTIETPNKNQLIEDIQGILERHDMSMNGQSASTLKKVINDAFDTD